jgi:hypothetical protein
MPNLARKQWRRTRWSKTRTCSAHAVGLPVYGGVKHSAICDKAAIHAVRIKRQHRRTRRAEGDEAAITAMGQ